MTHALLPLLLSAALAADPPPQNLLLNPGFAFHSFDNSRLGQAQSFRSGSVPCWSQDAYRDAEVVRGPRVSGFRPAFAVDGAVVIHPGKRLYQLVLLAEVGLDHGERVSLSVFGHQAAPDALQAAVQLVRLDSAEGDWSPADYGQADQRRFPKHSRGELIYAPGGAATSGAGNDFELRVENVEISGAFTEDANTATNQPNTIGVAVELSNRGAADVWVYSPCLARGALALNRLSAARQLPTYYRGIPRTIQKLWRGEPLHILCLGSSIDRGSANPPQYLYDEDPGSPTYKQPLPGTTTDFDGTRVGHPELNDYIAWWQHWFMYTGRLRRALMAKFDYPINKLLLNVMACDGSCIAESHSGFADYASLSIPPDPNLNGHRRGKSWQELYPDLFARPEGPRPDLVIFGSGANEKTDTPEETALFEAAVRWFQRHYPGVEFLFCMWQNREGYTANTGGLAELALRYQIPNLDLGRPLDLTTRYCNSYALVPRDGHPQAAAHDLWARQLEHAFDVTDPVQSGVAQLELPERLNPYTLGWEGDMITYPAGSPRLRGGTAFILDDCAVNLWATTRDETVGLKVDGAPTADGRRRPSGGRDVRNSTYTVGRLALGDRHVIEVTGTESRLVAVDAKVVPGRQWVGVDSPRWSLGALKPVPFTSEWGAPYGAQQVVLAAGDGAGLEFVGTDLSVAWVDQAAGGTLRVDVDGVTRLSQPTNVAFTEASGEARYMENRRGLRNLSYGWHTVKVAAADGPVALLGVFTYDTRANRNSEREVRGMASPGETIRLAAPYRARPWVICGGGLTVSAADASPEAVTFGGNAAGWFELVGE
ncbi:MAG: hypothetical protein HYU66_04815 [Armatimonadetes bacterium]|nr:hypothetical protein [Armatimonadota bacterium]